MTDKVPSPFCAPATHAPLTKTEKAWEADGQSFPLEDGLPLLAPKALSPSAKRQKEHYDSRADNYERNLTYPHTQTYYASLDDALMAVAPTDDMGLLLEVCCGTGEGFRLFKGRFTKGIGIDISKEMLKKVPEDVRLMPIDFAQGDATALPLESDSIDTIVMLGGIHHVNDRAALFTELFRVLKPGGTFLFRDPVNDFFLWRLLRSLIYTLSPQLDSETEHPLHYKDTKEQIEASGLTLTHWSTHGLIGFCLFMNSHVLVFNRAFRFIPGIKAITRFFARMDAWMIAHLPGCKHAGLIGIGSAKKPAA